MTSEPSPISFAFLDLETTGLDPERHEIWEIGILIDRFDDLRPGTRIGQGHYQPETVFAGRTFFLDPEHLETADAQALDIGRFYDRHPSYRSPQANAAAPHLSHPRKLAGELARYLDGVHLVGCTINFDAAFLGRWLRHNGQVPLWNYHLIDATVYAAGALGMRPPWKSWDVRMEYHKRTGLVWPHRVAHQALEDALMSRDLFYAALNRDLA